MYKGVCVGGFALLSSTHFLKYPMKMNNLVSLRPNYFIFTRYSKIRERGEGSSALSQTFSTLARTHLSPFARCTLGLSRHFY